MNILLDTCAFLWWAREAAKLSPAAMRAIKERSNDLFLSHASILEMQLKVQRGKLEFRQPLEEVVRGQCEQNALHLLPIESVHIFRLDQLPMHHGDPFDRLIISQAKLEGMSIATNDPEFPKYGVNIVW